MRTSINKQENSTYKRRKMGINHPWLSVFIAVCWLLLQHSVSPGNVFFALLLGYLLPRLLAAVLPPLPRIEHPWVVIKLFFVVLWDIVVANILVAKLVLGSKRNWHPAWVRYPLVLRTPLAIDILASIITTTPGTVSAVVDMEQETIWVHALDCQNAKELVLSIHQRYEISLQKIFESHIEPTEQKQEEVSDALQ